MSPAARKSTLSQFGLKCREARVARGLSLADQASGMRLLASEISGVEEAGGTVPTEEYIARFGAWLELDALELSKFKVFARERNNVVPFKPSKAHQESRRLFRKVNQFTPAQIRNLRPPLQDRE